MELATLGLKLDASGMVSGAQQSEKALRGVASEAAKAESASKQFESAVDHLRRGLEALGVTLGVLELLHAANEAREAAEQFEKLGAIAQQMAVTFGLSTQAIVASEQAMRDQGSTMEDARSATIKLLNAHIDLARATELTALAQNLAAKEGISEADAMSELILAIQTGMARTLKHAGVVADFTRATTDAANALGVQTDQLSEQALEHIRLEAVLKAGAGLQGAYAASLQTTSGQVLLAHKALSDLRLSLGTVIAALTEAPFEAASKHLQDMAKYARENPEIFARIAEALKVMGAAVAGATAAFVLYKTAALAASSATAILASIETITAFVELAKGIETAADAFALLGLAAESVNPVAILASLAAIAAGMIAWHEASKGVKADTEDFAGKLNGLGDAIKTAGTKAVQGNAGILSSTEALKRLTELRHEIPPFIADMERIAKAFGQSAGAGQLAEAQAKFNEELRKGTEGLIGHDKALATDLLTRKHVAETLGDHAKKLREVTDAGDAQVRESAQAVTQAFAFGDAITRSSIAFDHNTAIIAANQLELGGYVDAAARARRTADDVQRNALSALDITNQKAPWKDLLGGIEQGIEQFAYTLGTAPLDAFKNMTDTIRHLWGQLLADLVKMELEKKLVPDLAKLLGLDGRGDGSDVSGGGIVQKLAGLFHPSGGSAAGTVAASPVSIGGISLPAPTAAPIPASGGASLAATALPFAAAATGVIGLASALNSLIGASQPSREEFQKWFASYVTLQQHLSAYIADVNGSVTPLAAAVAAAHEHAKALRDEAEATLAGKRREEERNRVLAEITATEAKDIALRTIEVNRKQQEAAQDYDIRRLRAQGLSAEADALEFAEKQQREYNAALKEFGEGPVTDALKAAQEAERAQHDATVATTAAVEAHTDNLAAEAAAAREAADALAAFRSATDSLAAALAAGPNGTLASQNAAALLPLVDKQSNDALSYASALATLNADLADGGNKANVAADYMAVMTAGIVLAGDAAQIAAAKWQQAVAEMNAASSAIHQDVSLGFTSKSDAFEQEKTAFGFGGQTLDDIKSHYTPFTGAPLTEKQIEDNKNIGTLLSDFNTWFPPSGQSPLAGGIADALKHATGQTTAVTYAAKNLTEVTGNRMADYLASIHLGIRHLETIETEQLKFWNGVGTTPLPSFSPSAGNPSNPPSASGQSPTTIENHFTIHVTAPDGADGKALARLIAQEVDQILGDQLASVQLRDGNPLKSGF